jgi:hypothetical protein
VQRNSERYYVAAGSLISYGVNNVDRFRRAADYVDRILKGQKPADMPTQQPTKYELARPRRRGDRISLACGRERCCICSRQQLARSCRAGGADQCPKLGVERTQRGHAAMAAAGGPKPEEGAQ